MYRKFHHLDEKNSIFILCLMLSPFWENRSIKTRGTRCTSQASPLQEGRPFCAYKQYRRPRLRPQSHQAPLTHGQFSLSQECLLQPHCVSVGSPILLCKGETRQRDGGTQQSQGQGLDTSSSSTERGLTTPPGHGTARVLGQAPPPRSRSDTCTLAAVAKREVWGEQSDTRVEECGPVGTAEQGSGCAHQCTRPDRSKPIA